MSYRDFDLPTVQQRFGITSDHTQSLFATIPPVQLSVELAGYLRAFGPLGRASYSEKARSEFLIAPLLSEVWVRSGRQVAVYSGLEFNVDPENGLNGTCDFVLGLSKQFLQVEAPLLAVVEAKRDSIADGLGQCASEMVAALLFNQQKQRPIETIYGCVTTGNEWKFLQLHQKQILIDTDSYGIAQPEQILGILLHSCGVPVS